MTQQDNECINGRPRQEERTQAHLCSNETQQQTEGPLEAQRVAIWRLGYTFSSIGPFGVAPKHSMLQCNFGAFKLVTAGPKRL